MDATQIIDEVLYILHSHLGTESQLEHQGLTSAAPCCVSSTYELLQIYINQMPAG